MKEDLARIGKRTYGSSIKACTHRQLYNPQKDVPYAAKAHRRRPALRRQPGYAARAPHDRRHLSAGGGLGHEISWASDSRTGARDYIGTAWEV